MKHWDLVLVVVVVPTALFWALLIERDIAKACEARGGVYVHTACLRKDVVLP